MMPMQLGLGIFLQNNTIELGYWNPAIDATIIIDQPVDVEKQKTIALHFKVKLHYFWKF